jgi:hypothetical protein
VSTHARHVGILELVEICAELRARSLGLFEALGGWVAKTEAGPLQRLYAEACHRHAWHAELWAARLPDVPGDTARLLPPIAIGEIDPADRPAAYAARLRELRHDVSALSGRCDPDLDPSTLRVTALVLADLDDLLDRLT